MNFDLLAKWSAAVLRTGCAWLRKKDARDDLKAGQHLGTERVVGLEAASVAIFARCNIEYRDLSAVRIDEPVFLDPVGFVKFLFFYPVPSRRRRRGDFHDQARHNLEKLPAARLRAFGPALPGNEGRIRFQGVARGKLVAGARAEHSAETMSRDKFSNNPNDPGLDLGVLPGCRRCHNNSPARELVAVDVSRGTTLDPALECCWSEALHRDKCRLSSPKRSRFHRLDLPLRSVFSFWRAVYNERELNSKSISLRTG